MTRTYLNKVILIGVWGIAMAMTLTSCADDHFDIPEDSGEGNVATQSIWEVISSDASLSNFAKIAEKTPVYKDEKHPIANYTFKDVLSGDQVLTVFVPNNEAFTATDLADYEALLKTRPYDVFLSLVGNHLACGRYVASGLNPQGKAERLIFLNNKKGIFDREKKTIKDVAINRPNISATNGIVHVLGQKIPFAYNLYEYIRANKGYEHLNAWLSAHDTLFFNSNASAIAGTDKTTGEPIYVDSVYTRFNSLYYFSYQPNSVEWTVPHKGVAANLEQEDSIYAMAIPNDAAWEEAVATMKPWYNYADIYFDAYQENNALMDVAAGNRPTLEVKDTVQEAAISMDIVSPLVFNVRMQKRIKGVQEDFWTVESFLSHKMTKLFNTRSDTFTIDKDETEDVRDLIFEGKQPITVSNGLLYPLDHWNFRKTYKAFNIEIKANAFSIYQPGRYNLSEAEQKDGMHDYNATFESKSVDNGSELARKYGQVSKSSYLRFRRDSGQPKATFKLRGSEEDQDVLSNIEYEVGIVMVPDFYYNEVDPEEDPKVIKKNSLKATITYLSESKKEKTWSTKKAFTYEGEKVDTIWMDETITFPYSYRNITKAYPIFQIQSQAIPSAMERQGYQTTFSVDRIILRPKQEQSAQ